MNPSLVKAYNVRSIRYMSDLELFEFYLREVGLNRLK